MNSKISVTVETMTTPQSVLSTILGVAISQGCGELVARQLVAAKFDWRFQQLEIASSQTTDDKWSGVIDLNDCRFFVSPFPQISLVRELRATLLKVKGCYLLVSEANLKYAQSFSREFRLNRRVTVQSIESFVAFSVFEVSVLESCSPLKALQELIDVFNRRIASNEDGPSVELVAGVASP